MLTDRATAKTELTTLCDAASYPVLTTTDSGEIDKLLDAAQIASVWTASASREIGDKVVPTAAKRTGCMFKVISFDGSGVTNGTTEPTWTNAQGATYSDGHVTWQECGAQPSSLWNLNKAAANGWKLKASKVATEYDYGDADHKESTSQMQKQCLAQAATFATVEVA